MTTAPNDTPALLDALRQGTQHLTAMAKRLDFPWDESITDPRRLHNMYARNLITCYVSKFSDLGHGILESVERRNFLVYALCGRALIETIATLRHYVVQEYKPIFDKGQIDAEGMRRLIQVDDRHLRGTRFDWQSFVFQKYSKLKADVLANLAAKKKKGGLPVAHNEIIVPQINVLTCVEAWAAETPAVLVAYNLFCDLVHPNIGSAFLVASAGPQGLFFSRFHGDLLGQSIFERSLPILLAVAHRPFTDFLGMLMGTIWHDWHDDEVSSGRPAQ